MPHHEHKGAFPTARAYRAALSAPLDDEPVTEADVVAVARANEEIRAGKTVSHEEILREFGLR
jgi:hypothetical protein